MSVRKLMAASAAGVLVATTWSLAMPAPAHAEPAFTPDSNDIVGVGSDTTMHAMHFIADGYVAGEANHPGYNQLFAAGAGDARLASYDAFGERVVDECPDDTARVCVQLRDGGPLVTRPNGSGNGKATLYNPSNPDVNFARSSSGLNSTERNAGLYLIPFAFDGFKPAVRAAGSNAPAVVTAEQMLAIYKGEVTNWNQIGGQDGPIKPLVPQDGSGTYTEFNNSMKALNGGEQVTWAANSASAQEHDPTLIKDDPNAIAPFSTGRAKAFAGEVRILDDGWSRDRALYNVVRQGDLDASWVGDIFGSQGFVCSPEAKPLIEASGFEQLAPPALGGVCGEPTQDATTNFVTSPDPATTTTLVGTSPAANVVRLVANVNDGKVAAEGTVTFHEGATQVGEATVSARQAVLRLSGVASGLHTYTATFTPDSEFFDSSESQQLRVTVKDGSATALTVPAADGYGKARAIGVKVMAAGAPASGAVQVAVGSVTRTVPLSAAGVGTLTLPADQAAGTYPVVATYAGTAAVAGSSSRGTVTITKAGSKATERFKSKVRAAKLKGKVKVSVVGSAVKAAGKLKVLKGSKKVGSAKVRNGVAKLTLKGLKKGRNTFKAVYAGNRNVTGSTVKIVVTRK